MVSKGRAKKRGNEILKGRAEGGAGGEEDAGGAAAGGGRGGGLADGVIYLSVWRVAFS